MDKIQEIKAQKGLQRVADISISASRSSEENDSRIVELAFASELPYLRYWGYEILDCSVEAVVMDRVSDGAPLLLEHDRSKQIGVIESVTVDADRVVRAKVRFSKGELGTEIYNDVIDGIRKKVSVGYTIEDAKVEGVKDGTDVFRITKWQPFEVSIVSVPADNTVGIGRSLEEVKKLTIKNEENKMDDKEKELEKLREANANAERSFAEEQKRMSDIYMTANKYSDVATTELVQKAIETKQPAADFLAMIAERKIEALGAKKASGVELGLSEKEKENFSFLRLLRAQLGSKEFEKAAAYELEVCAAAALAGRASGRAEGGRIVLPSDILLHRSQNVGTPAKGGNLVANEFKADSFIDVLRDELILTKVGATYLDGLIGNVIIPRQTGSSTSYWVGEDVAADLSDLSFDQVLLSPKCVSALVKITRSALLQTTPAMEQLVRRDIARGVADKINKATLYGTGTTQPLGIKGTTGINTVDFAAGTPTWPEIVDLETQVAVDNALSGKMSYLSNPAMVGALKTAPKVAGYPVFIMGDNGQVNGYDFHRTNAVATGDIFFADWSQMLVGMWSGLDIDVNQYSDNAGGLTVRAFQDVDVGVRHPVAFVRGNNTL